MGEYFSGVNIFQGQMFSAATIFSGVNIFSRSTHRLNIWLSHNLLGLVPCLCRCRFFLAATMSATSSTSMSAIFFVACHVGPRDADRMEIRKYQLTDGRRAYRGRC